MSNLNLIVVAVDGPCKGSAELQGQTTDGVPDEVVTLFELVYPPGPLGDPNIAADPIERRGHRYARVGFDESIGRWRFQHAPGA